MASKKVKPEEIKTAQIEVVETNKTEKYDDLFILVQKNNEVRIAVTNKIISAKVFKSMEEAKKYIDSKPWELIVNVSCAIYDITKDLQK